MYYYAHANVRNEDIISAIFTRRCNNDYQRHQYQSHGSDEEALVLLIENAVLSVLPWNYINIRYSRSRVVEVKESNKSSNSYVSLHLSQDNHWAQPYLSDNFRNELQSFEKPSPWITETGKIKS